jgi:hypothetical protein
MPRKPPAKPGLTPAAARVLAAYRAVLARGESPTTAEVARTLGISATAAGLHRRNLARAGLLPPATPGSETLKACMAAERAATVAEAKAKQRSKLLGVPARGYARSLDEFRSGLTGAMIHGPGNGCAGPPNRKAGTTEGNP